MSGPSLLESGVEHVVTHTECLGDLDHQAHLRSLEVALSPAIDRASVQPVYRAKLGETESGALERGDDHVLDGLCHAGKIADDRQGYLLGSAGILLISGGERPKIAEERTQPRHLTPIRLPGLQPLTLWRTAV